MVRIKAVLFDLHETLVCTENRVSEEEISDFLLAKGYEVSPQQFMAAWAFVAFVDYPRYGYKNWASYFSRIFWRLKVNVDKETLDGVVKLLEPHPYKLYSDVAETVIRAKRSGFKTAIVTTIAHFQFDKAIEPIREYFDFIMTGFEARCDKTNPEMYRKVLEVLGVVPNEAVMVGDDIKVDVLLPARLGIHAILLDRKGQNLNCQVADAVARSLPVALDTVLKWRSDR